MAMPQRDEKIEAIKRLEPPSRKRYGGPGALLEYAVMHNEEAEADRLRRGGDRPPKARKGRDFLLPEKGW